ncbi:hypothetical protein, partial [Brevibacillus sp. SIMBA_040]|uniref:hypothetical protein n=1 Tax=Brevibacillus sp. SIMBA_040 TaxID=3085781 RepID=UPI00397814C1
KIINMKIRIKNKEKAILAKLYKEEYRVVAKQEDLGGGYSYLIFNENLQEMLLSSIFIGLF